MTIYRMAIHQTILYQTSRQFIEQPFIEPTVTSFCILLLTYIKPCKATFARILT